MFIQTYINTIMNNGIIAIIIHFDLPEATCQEYFKISVFHKVLMKQGEQPN